MKKLIKSKLFLQVIVASMVATLATVGIVAATSTIGADITTTGNLAFATASSTGIVQFSQIRSTSGAISFDNEILTTTGALAAATTTIALGDFTVGTTDFYVDDDNARVGIGSSTPSATLSLNTGTATTTIMGTRFCQFFSDSQGRGMWITLATSGNTVFATSTTPCNQ